MSNATNKLYKNNFLISFQTLRQTMSLEHLDGPDQVVPADSFTSASRFGYVNLRIEQGN